MRTGSAKEVGDSAELAADIELDDRNVGDDANANVSREFANRSPAVYRSDLGVLPDPSVLLERDLMGAVEEHGGHVLCRHT